VRVVVSTLQDLRKLQHHVENRRKAQGVKTIDYVDHPRQSGYRAVHLICMYGRDPRPVEVQLRTSTMHAWAEMVEQVSNIVGVNRKQDGDTAFHRWARLYSSILEAQELGKPSPVTDDEFNEAWSAMLEEGRSHD
ncbi:MAG TPA: RelA/SpoT domain-containing protein, partial [Propionibacterium sp.]|nr:RelA/SpoT domain-containing protein [Propionibacterium sp.]